MIVSVVTSISAKVVQLTRLRRSEMIIGAIDQENCLRSTREEPSPSLPAPMPGDDERSSLVTQGKKDGNRLEHWLQKVDFALQSEGAEKFQLGRIPTRWKLPTPKIKVNVA